MAGTGRLAVLLLTAVLGGCAMDADLPQAPAADAKLNDPAALEQMTERLRKSGAYETALAFAMRAARLDPDNAAHWERVHALAETVGRDDLARQALRQLATLDPEHPLLVIENAGRLLRNGRIAEAEAELARLPERRRPAGYYRIAGLIEEWKGRGVAARALYAQGLARFPEDPGLLVNLALSYALADDLAAANDILSQLADRGGALRRLALRNLVLAAYLAGDSHLAMRLAEEAGLSPAQRAFFAALADLSGPMRVQALITGRLPAGTEGKKPAPKG
ncbi:MAG: hypothetical protein D6740_11760 [Alphaproteobacteria bacterium]|nr:MAG: hypothetical protein D6740_11760 [Alphaproteobacteria bacterium]